MIGFVVGFLLALGVSMCVSYLKKTRGWVVVCWEGDKPRRTSLVTFTLHDAERWAERFQRHANRRSLGWHYEVRSVTERVLRLR